MFTYQNYINDIIDKKIVVCKTTYLSVKRHIDDIEKSKDKDYPFCFDKSEAERPIKFIQALVHTKGEWAGTKIKLEPWEQFIVAVTFGWRIKKDNLRRYKKIYVQISRKNGKTTLLSGIGNYCFFCDSPEEAGAEAYYIATKKDQAKIAWAEAERQIRKCKSLNKEATTYKQTSTIIKKRDTASRAKPLGKDSKTEDGLNPSFVGVDEYHAHPDNELLNVLESGMGARRQPLIFIITTAGFDKNSVCYNEYEYAKQILNRDLYNEEYFCIIYEPDEVKDVWVLLSELKEAKENKIKKEIETKIDSMILQSNPNIKISVKDKYIKDRLHEGLDKPYQRTDILTKNLNVWTQASQVWISSERWAYGNKSIDKEKLKGQRCCLGLDLATTKDIAAYTVCFFAEYNDNNYVLLPRFFMPKTGIRQRSKEDRVPYELWAEQGYITLTDGDKIDFEIIERSILNDAALYEILEIAYDPWKAIEIVKHLEDEGFKMQQIRQSFAVGGLSEGTSLFEKAIDERRVIHDNNPPLTWMMSCCEVKTDGRDNYLPVKPDRRKTYKRIDGVVSSIMALHSVVKNNFEQGSVYDKEGVLIL